MVFCCDRAVTFRVLVRTRLSNRAAILSAPFFRGGRSSDHVRGMVSEDFKRDCYIDTHAHYFRSRLCLYFGGKIDSLRTNVLVVVCGDDFFYCVRLFWQPYSMVLI